VYAGHRLLDVLVHGWDLAVATGQRPDLPPDLVQATWDIIEPQLGAWRAAGAIGDPVPVADDAPLQERLLGALGRKA
jgi:uncharacterized protein (TIGR03086 family)